MTGQKMLEVFVPDFSGFSSPIWASVVAGPRGRAAEAHELVQMGDYRLHREDFLAIYEESGDAIRQRAALAESFCDIFGVHLALKLGVPHGVQSGRYDDDSDRIVALFPLGAARWIVGHCEDHSHRRLDGVTRGELEALWAFEPHAGDRHGAAGNQAPGTMDAVAVGKLPRAFADPGIERTAIRAIEVEAAMAAFAMSIDADRYRAAKERRRREKYPLALRPSGEA